MDLSQTLIIFFGILNLTFGVFLYFNSGKSVVVRLYALIIIFATLWSLSTFFTTPGMLPFPYFVWAVYGHYIFGYLAYLSFFWFALFYPTPPKRFPLFATVLTIATIFFLVWIPIPGFLFERLAPAATLAASIDFNLPVYVTFIVMLSFVFFTALLTLLRTQRLRTRDVLYKDLDQYQIYFAILANFVAGILGIVFNLIFPLYGNFSFFYINPILVTSALISIGLYNMLRYNFFNARIILSEFFTGGILILSLTRFILSPSGTERVIDGILLLIMTAFGAFLIQSIFREVRLRAELEKLNEERSEFMSFASHEIRNPITAMRGYASLIVDGTAGEVSAQAKDSAEKILVNGNTVLSLISQFLNKSKLELGQISYAITEFDAEETVSSVADGFKPHAQQKGLALEKHIDFPHLKAHGDEAKLREVVGNLIDNSIKYTKSGSITVLLEKRNSMARIIIQDTGVGIPHETLPHLFQKFSRADAHKMNLLGTGLGLYLAKTFIEGMGGKIWAESDGQDKGSRFIIELPAVT
jgi:signal transduction histidine kinase